MTYASSVDWASIDLMFLLFRNSCLRSLTFSYELSPLISMLSWYLDLKTVRRARCYDWNNPLSAKHVVFNLVAQQHVGRAWRWSKWRDHSRELQEEDSTNTTICRVEAGDMPQRQKRQGRVEVSVLWISTTSFRFPFTIFTFNLPKTKNRNKLFTHFSYPSPTSKSGATHHHHQSILYPLHHLLTFFLAYFLILKVSYIDECVHVQLFLTLCDPMD